MAVPITTGVDGGVCPFPDETLYQVTQHPLVTYLFDHTPYTELAFVADVTADMPAGLALGHPCDSI
ncbi:hypothetical protein [Chitinophaga sp. MD30]|uniref:hypothetical protein n=1 Tax=Chitinophaga sp. MD30 TaxID=2033437 RepID=UPI000BAF73E2|nr:hypothetical protein [Chitinophaga sp. MD30]ASZ11230.1 hypothetical protein CK934_09765 [Chitinophaga sp. MD30]